MDSMKRKTLEMIEEVAMHLPVHEASRQLLMVAADYVDEGEGARARSVLVKIPIRYYEDYLPKQVSESSITAQALLVVIREFGLGFQHFLKSKGAA